ncbi:MAG TPA: hypothetical protein VG893_08870, partial [Terracidiphilus sp.]|nr:hypothetical protein [Terracidiphilus sp.]
DREESIHKAPSETAISAAEDIFRPPFRKPAYLFVHNLKPEEDLDGNADAQPSRLLLFRTERKPRSLPWFRRGKNSTETNKFN